MLGEGRTQNSLEAQSWLYAVALEHVLLHLCKVLTELLAFEVVWPS